MSLTYGMECVFLLSLILLCSWDLTNLPDSPKEFVQLETFNQLVASITEQNITYDADGWIPYDDSLIDESTKFDKPECPIDEERLKYFVDLVLDTWLSYEHIEHGGHFRPVGCSPKQRVAIIVPQDGSQERLERFLLYIHQFLPDQLIDYRVVVVEQKDAKELSKSRLMNIGAAKIMEIDPSINCFVFHEADLIPLNQRNLYMCSLMPRHLSTSISSYRYHLMYPRFFGGVISMTKAQYKMINGLPDELVGSGRIEEDSLDRIVSRGLRVERSPSELGIYITTHNQWARENRFTDRKQLPSEYPMPNSEKRTSTLAMSQVSIEVELRQLYTHIKCGPHQRRGHPLLVDL